MRKPTVVAVYEGPNLLADALPRVYLEALDVRFFTSGPGALEYLDGLDEGHPCALFIADLRMHPMMGRDFLMAARARFPKARTALLAAPGDFRAVVDAIVDGVDSYMLKSLLPPERRVYPIINALLGAWARETGGLDPKLFVRGQPAATDLRVRRATRPADVEQCQRVRYQVWAEELKWTETSDAGVERDAEDERAAHFLAIKDDDPVGTLRLLTYQPGAGPALPIESMFDLRQFKARPLVEVSRFAVLARHRGGDTGFALMHAALWHCFREGIYDAVNAASPLLADYYEGLGFRAFDAPRTYETLGLPAVPMHLDVDGLDIRYKKKMGLGALSFSATQAGGRPA